MNEQWARRVAKPGFKELRSKQRKAARLNRLNSARENERERKRLSLYNLTPETFAAMRAEQDDRCAICKEVFVETPHVDHDHSCCPGIKSCGKCVRGLLCSPCNKGIGHLRDNVLIIESALKYLRGRDERI